MRDKVNLQEIHEMLKEMDEDKIRQILAQIILFHNKCGLSGCDDEIFSLLMDEDLI